MSDSDEEILGEEDYRGCTIEKFRRKPAGASHGDQALECVRFRIMRMEGNLSKVLDYANSEEQARKKIDALIDKK